MASTLCVLGSGNWGTTIAVLLAGNGHQVRLWGNSPPAMEEMRILGENRTFLPGVTLPQAITPTADLTAAMDGAEAIYYAVPSQAMREVARQVAERLSGPRPLHVSLSKGIEISTLMRMTEVIRDELPADARERVVALSGPSLAREVSMGMPTTVVVASERDETAREAQSMLMADTFRVYTNTDLVGVELGGALKNVVAIAAGVADGLGYGDNTRGALITRGLAEMVRMASTMGARRETFAGLAGMGDLITTCSSSYSRNHQVGVEIARGRSLAEITEEMVMVAEGVPTTRAVHEIARRHQVEMPIAQETYGLLFTGKDAREAIRDLMLRRPRAEVW